MNFGDDPYQILGVDAKADYTVIKKAYRKLALKQHPDKGGDPVQFAKIANAYEIVGDPKQRHNYDLQQSNGTNQGYDPKGPEFTNTSDEYDPNKPSTTFSFSPSGNQGSQDGFFNDHDNSTYTTTQSSPKKSKHRTRTTTRTSTASSMPQEWTTTYTTSQPQTTTYTTTTTSSSIPRTTSSRTTEYFEFHDPMEIFRQHFPDAALHHKMSSSPRKSPKKLSKRSTKIPTSSMSQMSMNDPSPSNDKEVMGMASSSRTVTHPNGQKEQITETVWTYSDGSTETKSSSKFLGGTTSSSSNGSQPRKISTTTSSSQPIVTTKTTTRQTGSTPKSPTKMKKSKKSKPKSNSTATSSTTTYTYTYS